MTAHEKTTASYRPTREEGEQVTLMLYKHYPACFFEEGKLRRPLKHGITADIIKNDFQVAPELIIAVVNFYKNHMGYKMQTVAGSKRIDLDGRETGTVTEQEAMDAKRELDEIYKNLDELLEARQRSFGPEFAPLHETLTAANAAVVGINDPAMRVAVAKTLLDIVIKKAQQVRSELETKS